MSNSKLKLLNPKKAKASKSTAGKVTSPAKTPDVPSQPEEVNPGKLSIVDARNRCDAIYKLTRSLEDAQRVFDKLSTKAKVAKAKLAELSAALSQEINEQRFGPGPLFPVDGPDA